MFVTPSEKGEDFRLGSRSYEYECEPSPHPFSTKKHQHTWFVPTCPSPQLYTRTLRGGRYLISVPSFLLLSAKHDGRRHYDVRSLSGVYQTLKIYVLQ